MRAKTSFNSREINPKKRESNAIKNHVVRKKMDTCEQLTGLTCPELIEQQRNLRADMYKRLGRKVPK